MLSSSSSQDLLMRISRIPDITVTVPSGTDNVTWTFDGFAEKGTPATDVSGWAIRRTEKYYPELPGSGMPPEMALFLDIKPIKVIVTWAFGNPDLYSHIFDDYLIYEYRFIGADRPPVLMPPMVDKLKGDYIDEARIPGAEIYVDINPNGTETNISIEYGNTTAYSESIEVKTVPAGNDYVTVVGYIENLLPGLYHFRVIATNTHGSVVSEDNVIEISTGIGVDETDYQSMLPTLTGAIYYIDPGIAVGGDGLTHESAFKTWDEVSEFGNNNKYLQKRGTAITLSKEIIATGAVQLGAYGDENLPRPIISVGSNLFIRNNFLFFVENIEFQALSNGSIIQLDNSTDTYFYNCIFSGGGDHIVVNGNPSDSTKYFLKCEFKNTNGSAINTTDSYLFISGCYFHDNNTCLNALDTLSEKDIIIMHCTFTGLYDLVTIGAYASGDINNNHFFVNSETYGENISIITVQENANLGFYRNIFENGSAGINTYGELGIALNVFRNQTIGVKEQLNTSTILMNNVFIANNIAVALNGNGLVNNNVFLNCNSAYEFIITSPDYNIDYNHFSETIPVYGRTMLEWQSEGYDVNSSIGDALLSLNTGLDCRPLNGSQLIGTGTTTIISLPFDFTGQPIQLPVSKGLYDGR
jgi:hypothetical protein